MSSTKIETALNSQLNRELFSSYLYLSMSAYFESVNMNGMAKWMRAQSTEEYGHAMKFFDFINKVGGRIILEQIERPKDNWNSAHEIFSEALEHERFITKSISQLMDLAHDEKDHPAKSFLQWFIDEQVEEENSIQQIVENFKLIGDNKSGLFMLDRELGSRAILQT